MATCVTRKCNNEAVSGWPHCAEHMAPSHRAGAGIGPNGEPAPQSALAPARPSPSTRYQQQQQQSGDGLEAASAFVYIIAVLTLLAALIAGIALIAHTEPSDCFDSFCDGSAHPFAGAGIAILVGGVAQASLWCVLARVAGELSKVRAAVKEMVLQ